MSSSVVVQDLSLPYSTTEEFIAESTKELEIWPLWLCPLRETSSPSFHPHTTLPGPDDTPKPMLNIGLWGRGANRLEAFVAQNRKVEAILARLGGRKVLYSHAYYTEQEFWDIYDRQWYDGLRRRYNATTLPSVFDKVKADLRPGLQASSWQQWLMSLWPVPGIVGIYAAIKSKDYFYHRPDYADPATPQDDKLV